ncbi:hypothetical protein [Rhizobium laguerreae]|nr:hypothetical protein [Rhizobium laguerreae]
MRRPDAATFGGASDRREVLTLDITKPETIKNAIVGAVASSVRLAELG